MNRMSLIILIDQLENLLKSAPQVPLSGRSLVDVDEALELLEKIRTTFPEEVRKAEHLAGERDKLLAEGQKRAERIVAAAEEHAATLLAESEILRLARKEAEKIVLEARQTAAEMEQGARAYANETLAELESLLKKTLITVDNGRRELSGKG